MVKVTAVNGYIAYVPFRMFVCGIHFGVVVWSGLDGQCLASRGKQSSST
jgi:hypothetical protein